MLWASLVENLVLNSNTTIPFLSGSRYYKFIVPNLFSNDPKHLGGIHKNRILSHIHSRKNNILEWKLVFFPILMPIDNLDALQ